MVILMGVRLDKYREKKKRKHRKIYGFLKFLAVISLFFGLGLSIIYVNTTIEDLNYLENTVLLGIDFEEKIITLLGKSYIIEIEKILAIIKPD